jgi:hypothetical protein
MRLFDLAMRFSPSYRQLKHDHESLRERHALLSSATGAGLPGHANCDTTLVHKFVELESDYESLEHEVWDLYAQNYMLKQQVRSLLDITV